MQKAEHEVFEYVIRSLRMEVFGQNGKDLEGYSLKERKGLTSLNVLF